MFKLRRAPKKLGGEAAASLSNQTCNSHLNFFPITIGLQKHHIPASWLDDTRTSSILPCPEPASLMLASSPARSPLFCRSSRLEFSPNLLC